jgi:D-lyxose ketol-isomerase
MKRSEINHHLQFFKSLAARHGFHLPPFAFWPPEQWIKTAAETELVRTQRLGWDITDFNLGTFEQKGLTLFTLRNGQHYCEKLMVAYPGQVTPFHFHWKKTEDIINRGAGVLVVEVYNSTAEAGFASTPVRVTCDGLIRELPAGGRIELHPGQSITLVPYLYHSFHPRVDAGPALIGEVSTTNDDVNDNRFHEPLPRFPSIDEDEKPIHLLCTEYPTCR